MTIAKAIKEILQTVTLFECTECKKKFAYEDQAAEEEYFIELNYCPLCGTKINDIY